MAKFFPRSNKKSIEFDVFLSKLDALGADIFSKKNFNITLDLLQRLYENRTFMTEVANEFLTNMNSQLDNPYTGQVLVLAEGEHYMIRAPMWVPQGELVEDNMYAYGLAHDHDFNLLSIGYLGLGYKTNVYQYDTTKIKGYDGEDVIISEKESHHLNEGGTIFLKANSDIHVQYPPDDISLSLNILKTSNRTNKQYLFDIDMKKISQQASNNILESITDMADIFGDITTFKKLEELNKKVNVNNMVRT